MEPAQGSFYFICLAEAIISAERSQWGRKLLIPQDKILVEDSQTTQDNQIPYDIPDRLRSIEF